MINGIVNVISGSKISELGNVHGTFCYAEGNECDILEQILHNHLKSLNLEIYNNKKIKKNYMMESCNQVRVISLVQSLTAKCH